MTAGVSASNETPFAMKILDAPSKSKGEKDTITHIDVVDTDSLQDLGLDSVANSDLGHDGDRDGSHDLLDHAWVALGISMDIHLGIDSSSSPKTRRSQQEIVTAPESRRHLLYFGAKRRNSTHHTSDTTVPTDVGGDTF